mmetsp:Transcript_21459/g.44891  ORF Transcript_21459/g.44891 Transcript_21459/m.44891 type:complete len:226 (-) Transcript_21459:716-1393(-)
MQPIVGNVLVRLGLPLHHLIVRRVRNRARREETRDAVTRSRRDLLDLVHVLPSRREDDCRASAWAVGSEDSPRLSDFFGEGGVFYFVIVVVFVERRYFFDLGVRIIRIEVCILGLLGIWIWIVEHEVPSLKVLALRAQIQYARVVIPVMRRLIRVQGNEVSLAATSTLLDGTRHVLARVRLQRQYRLQRQAVLMRDGTADAFDKTSELQYGRGAHVGEVIEREPR